MLMIETEVAQRLNTQRQEKVTLKEGIKKDCKQRNTIRHLGETFIMKPKLGNQNQI